MPIPNKVTINLHMERAIFGDLQEAANARNTTVEKLIATCAEAGLVVERELRRGCEVTITKDGQVEGWLSWGSFLSNQ